MTSPTRNLLSLAAISLCTGTTIAGTVLHADDGAPPGGDGQSWATAYRFLQDALADAEASGGLVNEIRVARGLYFPDRSEANPGGSGDREATFQLVNDVLLAGGYAGLGAPDPDARDVSAFVTTLTGDLLRNDGKDFVNYEENSFHVVTGSFNDDTAIIEGVTVTAGNASGPDDDNDTGGGMIIQPGNPTVRKCRFEYNRAAKGAGIEIKWTTSPWTISGSTFVGNVAHGHGPPWVRGSGGGGIRCRAVSGTVTISNCSFIANSSTQPPEQAGGGGVLNQGSDGVNITGCLFVSNHAEFEGGAMVTNFGGLTTFSNSTVVSNSAGLSGGGLCAAGGGTVDVFNSVIYSNFLGPDGISDPQIFVLHENAVVNVSSTNTEGGLGGFGIVDLGGNIDADPLFVDAGGGDYRLAAGSPSINTGDLAAVPDDLLVDRDGNPRLIDCQVDMGAYEHQVPLYAPGDSDCDGVVGVTDFLDLLGHWGECHLCPADTDHDGDVDVVDMLALLANWG